jgi:uncharacterized protein
MCLASLDREPYRDAMTQPPNPSDDIPGPGPGVPPPPPPQPGSYPPPGAYPPPGPVPPPPGYASSEDKTWVLVAHFGGAAAMFVSAGTGGWIPPLIAMLVQGQKSPQVRAHAVGALNFQLLLSIIGVIGWITACFVLGFIIWPIATLLGVIFGIIAGMRANEGQFYQYPFNISIVK